MKFVQCSPDSSLNFPKFVCYNKELELFVIERHDGISSMKKMNHRVTTHLTSMDWCKDKGVSRMVWGGKSGVVSVVDWGNAQNEPVLHAGNASATAVNSNKRACTSVSWNAINHAHVAAGFDVGTNEHCVLVWDINAHTHAHSAGTASIGTNASAGAASAPDQSRALLRLCLDEPISSMSWLPRDPHILCVGTQDGWLKLYDTRIDTSKSEKAASISIYAHAGKRKLNVAGVRPDPFHPELLATFSDSQQDSVKIWDIRTKSGSKSKVPVITIVPHGGAEGHFNQASRVNDAAWHPTRESMLCVATSNHKQVLLYSTVHVNHSSATADGVMHTPHHFIATQGTVHSLSWQRHADDSVRLLGATTAGLADIRIVEAAPIACSPQGVAVSAGKDIIFSRATGALNDRQQVAGNSFKNVAMAAKATSTAAAATAVGALVVKPSILSVPVPGIEDTWGPVCWDTGQIMRARSAGGYSLDAGKNMQVLSDELDAMCSGRRSMLGATPASSPAHARASSAMTFHAQEISGAGAVSATQPVGQLSESDRSAARQIHELFRLWSWVDRVETLCGDEGLGLPNIGIRASLQQRAGRETAAVSPEPLHPLFRIPVYESSSSSSAASSDATSSSRDCRMHIRNMCGWASSQWEPSRHYFPGDGGSGSQSPGPSARRQSLGGGVSPSSKSVRSASARSPKSRASGTAESAAHFGTFNGSGEGDEGMMVDMSELEMIVEECELIDSVERAAAVAMWHGYPDLAISVLQRYVQQHQAENLVVYSLATCENPNPNPSSSTNPSSNHMNGNHSGLSSSGPGWDFPITPAYTQLLQIVAMCFAGLGGGEMWVSMCENVLQQLRSSKRAASAYLAAVCQFLLEVSRTNANAGTSKGAGSGRGGGGGVAGGVPSGRIRFHCIINNDAIHLEDRLGFASFYLADAPMLEWVQSIAAESIVTGRLQGLLLTGMQEDGMKIMQQYVNRFEDLQTVALLIGRSLQGKPPVGTEVLRDLASAQQVAWSWMFEYRMFLNGAQLYVARASLDVELGRLQRQRKEAEGGSSAATAPAASSAANANAVTKSSAAPPLAGSSTNGAPRTGGPTIDRRSSASRAMHALPAHNDHPHVFLRCNFCSASLPVDAMQQLQHTAFLRKQKPVINFCASCKKPLPRCYVCQLYVGLVNPHAEVSRIQSQKRRVLDRAKAASKAGTGGTTAISALASVGTTPQAQAHALHDVDDHNVLDFGRWLFFCQRCKHGGHASCIDQWFEGDSEILVGGQGRRIVCGVNGCDCLCGNL